MTKRMLIDASHPEETRVVVLDGNKLDDFDYESTSRRTLKGNIYLGKITRVEPSLQAAFVEYGGNRHGFLPFSDIHPDYYRIPVADREALIAHEIAHGSDHDADHGSDDGDHGSDEGIDGDAESGSELASGSGRGPQRVDTADGYEHGTDGRADHGPEDGPENGGTNGGTNGAGYDEDAVETVGGDEIEAPRHSSRNRRHYKIQEVIKRRQIVLVQVTKEERGNKGAALTTYISLAGRYCVLMPNAVRGGGISRKITDAKDRRRLKEVIDSLEVPQGMGVILRTAGMERNKTEIRRDYEFLTRVWDEIREKTFVSRAPALIYEEADLIKRTIRDTYSRDIEEILVEGEEAYRTAKAFMRALMPSHAKRVQLYKDRNVHLFPSLQVESQLDALHATTVRLKSGGYIVINLTEALVAIDVNSGRATRERHIEETALRTNLEAASEIARQLRLRDLAGLVVIDFIDMEDRRNNAAVERRLKEAMKLDRARVQIGRISPLGLLELSRQRLRPSLLETSMQTCPHCEGRGMIRTVQSTAMHVFRAIEEEAVRQRSAEILVYVPTPVALFLLNQKRDALQELEQQQGLRVLLDRDDTLISPAYRIEHLKPMPPEGMRPPAVATAEVAIQAADLLDEEETDIDTAEAASAEEPEAPAAASGESAEIVEAIGTAEAGEDSRSRRRRRGRRGGRRRGQRRDDQPGETESFAADGSEDEAGDLVPDADLASELPDPTMVGVPEDGNRVPDDARDRPAEVDRAGLAPVSDASADVAEESGQSREAGQPNEGAPDAGAVPQESTDLPAEALPQSESGGELTAVEARVGDEVKPKRPRTRRPRKPKVAATEPETGLPEAPSVDALPADGGLEPVALSPTSAEPESPTEPPAASSADITSAEPDRQDSAMGVAIPDELAATEPTNTPILETAEQLDPVMEAVPAEAGISDTVETTSPVDAVGRPDQAEAPPSGNGASAPDEEALPAEETAVMPAEAAQDRPRRRGWWQRLTE